MAGRGFPRRARADWSEAGVILAHSHDSAEEMVQCPHCGFEFIPGGETLVDLLKNIQRRNGGIRTVAVASHLNVDRTTAWRKLILLEQAGIIQRPANRPKSPFRLVHAS